MTNTATSRPRIPSPSCTSPRYSLRRSPPGTKRTARINGQKVVRGHSALSAHGNPISKYTLEYYRTNKPVRWRPTRLSSYISGVVFRSSTLRRRSIGKALVSPCLSLFGLEIPLPDPLLGGVPAFLHHPAEPLCRSPPGTDEPQGLSKQ